VYIQEYVEGTSFAAAYLGDGRQAQLLGVTRQLVGEPWLNAASFDYCGSIGPVPIPAALRRILERLGDVLVKGSRLRGLFGVDFILRDGEPWPVEVNPRYTASLEVLEYASGLPVLALHRRVFEPDAPLLAPASASAAPGWIGKAILFARTAAVFPTEGPWQAALRHPPSLDALPAFADIPPAGHALPAGGPVLTFFARGSSLADCEDTLRQTAADLDRRLFGR
jgi:predicted ATP-grasp superfamily ATP-dependent carboligase